MPNNVEVTGLDLNIKATANLSETVSQLEQVAKTLSAITFRKNKVEGLQNLSKSVNAFALAVNKIDLSKISKLSESITVLSNLQVSNKASNSITKLTESLNNVDFRKMHGQVDALARTLEPLAATLERIASVSKTVNLGAWLGRAVGRTSGALEAELEKQASKKITVSSNEDVVNKAERIKMAWAEISNAFQSTKLAKGMDTVFEPLRRGASTAVTAVNNVKTTWQALDQLFQESTFAKSVDAVFGAIKKGVQIAVGAFRALIGIIQKTIKAVGRIGAAFGKVASVISKIGIINPFRGFATAVKGAIARVNTLFKSLKRIAFYRAIRTAIKAITEAIKTGVNNLYYWSQAVGSDFAPAMDKISTAMLYFKNSIGAAVSPLITYFAPAIDMAIDKIVELINIMNQLFAKLTGRSNWTKALKYPSEYAEATAGATKKMKDNIQDFDELHILRTDNGGGGGSALNYEDMFEIVDLDSGFAQWIEQFKLSISRGDWEGAGRILGDEVNSVLDSVNWREVGATFAEKFNHAIQLYYGFLDQTNFDNIGKDVAQLLNGAFEKIDAKTLGRTLAKKYTTAIDFLYGFVSDFDFPGFGTKVSEFVQGWFEEIDGHKLAETISGAIKGAFTAGTAFLSNGEMLNEIVNDINGFFNGFDWNGIRESGITFASSLAESVKNFIESTDIKKIGETLSNIINTGLDMALEFIDDGGLDAIVEGLVELFNGVDWYNILLKTLTIGAAIAKAIVAVIKGALFGGGGSAQKQIDSSYGAWKASTYDGMTRYTASTDFGSEMSSSIADSISGMDWSPIASALGEILGAAWDAAILLADFITEPAAEAIGGAITDVVEGYHLDKDGNIEEADPNTWYYKLFHGVGDATAYITEETWWGKVLNPSYYAMGSILNKFDKNKNDEDKDWIIEPLAQGGGGGRFAAHNRPDLGTDTKGARNTKGASYDRTSTAIQNAYKTGRVQAEKQLTLLSTNTESKVKSINSRISTPLTKIGEIFTTAFRDGRTNSERELDTLTASSATKINNVTSAVISPLETFKTTITTAFANSRTNSEGELDSLNNNSVTKLNNLSAAIVTPLNDVKSKFETAFTDAKQGSVKAIEDIKPGTDNALKDIADNAVSPNLSRIKGLWETLHGNVKTSSNGIITVSEGMANGITDAFNQVGENINKMSIEFPDWVPDYGGKKMQFALPKLGKISIPKLATGGIVSSPTTALIGEAGSEAVLPLENNTSWMDVLATRINAENTAEIALLQQQNDLLRQIVAKKTGITPREAFDAVRDEAQEYFVRTGTNALVM